MNRLRHTKIALIMSVVSLVTCMAMFVGSTFAWFTDSVSTGVNKIVSGNLDIGMEYATFDSSGAFAGWKDATAADSLFTGALWEPGHAEVVYLKISNAGSLTLKYQFAMQVSETEAISVITQKPFKLSDFIKYGVTEVNGQTDAYASRQEAINAVSDSAVPLAAYSKSGTLAPSADEAYIALVLYMPSDVSNEANYDSTKSGPPTIDIGITLLATQQPSESDSFGSDYDNGAQYGAITSDQQFSELIDDINTGKDVAATIAAPVVLEDSIEISDGQKVSLELMGGADIQFDKVKNNEAAITVNDGATLEISGSGTLSTDRDYLLTVQQGGSAVISDIDVKAQSEYHWGNYAFYNYGSLTVNNVDFTVSSSYQEQGQGGNSAYGIYTFNAESLVVDGCTFSVDGAYTGNTGNSAYGVYVRDTENVEIKNCDITVTGQGGSVYGIYLFSGDIDLISNVKIDSGGTGIYTKNPINRIESSVIKGSDYSLRIFSPGYANVTRDTEFIGTASTDYINYVD